jgi:hypothetical protein
LQMRATTPGKYMRQWVSSGKGASPACVTNRVMRLRAESMQNDLRSKDADEQKKEIDLLGR